MKMQRLKVVFVFFLMGVTIFSIFKYILSLKEREGLLNNLNQAKEQLIVLENEKQNLLQGLQQQREDNNLLKDSLKQTEEKLVSLNTEFRQVQDAMEELNSRISILKVENTALRDQEGILKTQFVQSSQENEALKARFNSLAELKKAIRDLKQKLRQARREAGIGMKEAKPAKIIDGNRGFLIKSGKPTYGFGYMESQTIALPAYPAAVKIEVEPASSP